MAGYVWIDTPSALTEMLARLSDEPLVAVDTESDSLHVYFEKVCLVQLSIPGVDYLVDPLRVDIQPLGDLFASEAQEKVFHAAEYDIMCLKRDYGFTFAHLFDTMIAARVLGWKRFGLADILETHLNVHLDKRLQRFNWGIRPLPESALEYASNDSRYLLPLRELQLSQLQARGRLEEARQAFRRQTRIGANYRSFDPEGFWRLVGARQLEPTQQSVLRQLYILRDELARELDLPPFKVIANAVLVRLAQVCPNSRRSLVQVRGLSHRVRKDYADRLLQAIHDGCRARPPVEPIHMHARMSDQVVTRYQALRAWRKEAAAVRQVDPDVILPNHVLKELARCSPVTADALTQLATLDDWQRQSYGEELLRVLRKTS